MIEPETPSAAVPAGPRRFAMATEFEVGLSAAAAAVAQGLCVVLPTDTVYGIGADPFRAEAVDRLLGAKRRGRDMPVPVLISDPGMLRALAARVPDAAKRLAAKVWPGALTLILPAQPALALRVGDANGTVAVRVPDHAGARALLRRTGPLAVSSANTSGSAPAIHVDQAVADLADAVAVYLDDGPSPIGLPSSIVDFTRGSTGVLLRTGALSWEALEEAAPGAVERPEAAEGLRAEDA